MIVGALLLLASAASPAANAETIRFAQTFPPGTKDARAVKTAAEKVQSVTEGRIQIEWAEMKMEESGATPDLLADLRSGETQLVALPTMAFSAQVDEALAYGLPMLFRSESDLKRAEAAVRERVEAAFQAAGLVTIARVDRGFAHVLSVGPIATPDDLSAARLWLPDGPAFASLGDVISKKTIHAPFGDVPKHLERAKAGDQDAANTVISGPTMVILQGWHEHLTDVLMTPVFPLDLRLVMDKAVYDRLNQADREALTEEMTRAFQQVADLSAKSNKDWPRTFKRFGIKIHRPTGDSLKPWTDWGRSVQDRVVVGHPGAASLLAGIRKSLEDS